MIDLWHILSSEFSVIIQDWNEISRVLSAFNIHGGGIEGLKTIPPIYHFGAFVRFLNRGMIGISKNPAAPGEKLRAAAYQLLSTCQQRSIPSCASNKKGIRKLTAEETVKLNTFLKRWACTRCSSTKCSFLVRLGLCWGWYRREMMKQEWSGDIFLTWLAGVCDVIGYSAAPYRF